MEVEILKEALAAAREKKPVWQLPSPPRGSFPVKVVADTLGVARSNLDRAAFGAPNPAAATSGKATTNCWLAIRQLTDARPTYGYRRITALLNRASRASGAEPVNHKRVFRLMAPGQLLLQPHVGLRPVRAHEGSVIALASNQRWSSDGWKSVAGMAKCPPRVRHRHLRPRNHRLARHTGGISGEMVRDLMLACVERRFAAIRAPHPVQWLADNGSAYAAARHWSSLQRWASLPASPQCAARKQRR